MNNSSDFQPKTRNPQSEVGGGLQPKSAPLQPVTGTGQSSDINPNALPITKSLKVTTANNGSSTQLTPSDNLQVTSAISSGWFFGVVTVLTIIIFWVFGKIFSPAKNTVSSDDLEPVVIEKPVLVTKPKKKAKKKTSKKNSKKRK